MTSRKYFPMATISGSIVESSYLQCFQWQQCRPTCLENIFHWKVFRLLSLRSEEAMFSVATMPFHLLGKYFPGETMLLKHREKTFQWKVFLRLVDALAIGDRNVSGGNNAQPHRSFEDSFQWKVFRLLSLRSEEAMFSVATMPSTLLVYTRGACPFFDNTTMARSLRSAFVVTAQLSASVRDG